MMAERERIANHLGDIGAICNDVAFTFAFYQFGRLREEWQRLSREAFGHRFMMDRVVPGGVAVDLDAALIPRPCATRYRVLRRQLDKLMAIVNESPSLEDRLVTTGVLKPGVRQGARLPRLCRARQRRGFRRAPRCALCALRPAEGHGAGIPLRRCRRARARARRGDPRGIRTDRGPARRPAGGTDSRRLARARGRSRRTGAGRGLARRDSRLTCASARTARSRAISRAIPAGSPGRHSNN